MTTITIDKELLEQVLAALETMTDEYDDSAVGLEIEAIHALRAALSAPATAPDLSAAYIGAREDLAVWKKRALEAEETARQLNRALAEEVNGPTFMGEPVLPATTPEKTVKEIMEFVRHYAANTFSSATLEDKIRRSLETPATAPERKPMPLFEINTRWEQSVLGITRLQYYQVIREVEAFHDIKETP